MLKNKTLKKILLTVLIGVGAVNTVDASAWFNNIYAEKNSYSYSAKTRNNNGNVLEYRCSVLKLSNGVFGKIDYVNIDLDLNLENGNLSFQDEYTIKFLFSSGKQIVKTLTLKTNSIETDRFTFYLRDGGRDSKKIMKALVYGNSIKITVLDDGNEKHTSVFYLNGSGDAINKSKVTCNMLFQTFN